MTQASAEYRVTEVDARASADDLQRVWQANLPVKGDLRRKLDWFYLDSPSGPAHAFVLQARTDDGGARVIGSAGAGIRTIAIGKDETRAALLADLAVDKEHRRLLPALMLVRSTRGVLGEHCHFAYGFPNAAAEPVFLRAGYSLLGRLTRHVRVLRHRTFVAKRVPSRPAVEVASALLDGWGLGTVLLRRLTTRGRLEWLDGVDARFDRLWNLARGDYDIVARRDAALLRWRFLSHPSVRYRVAALTDRRGELLAYAVVERQATVLHIRDLCGRTQALGTLLDHLAYAAWRQGATTLSLRHLGSERMDDLFRRHGFAAREQTHAVVISGSEPGRARRVENAGRWHLTDADEDT
jgi:hypothetical protein